MTQLCVASIAVDGFVFDRGVHPDDRVASLPVLEDLEELEDHIGEFDVGHPSTKPRVPGTRGHSVGLW